ncbi:hypothetical protein GQ457_09G021290 [Hibiscus cannabinus]
MCIDFDGLGYPSGLAPSLHLNSPSVEMVPDSLDGLENHLEGQIQNCGGGERCGGKSSLAPASANSSSLSFRKKSGNSFYNASHRREVRRVVRESLEAPNLAKSNSSSLPCLEKIKSLEEALAVWEVSKVLEISFVGGKKMVMKKVREIEEASSLSQ